MASKVIVFGPTGAVGGAAAREAHARGAHVVLAMRDTSKATPGLPDLPKVRADLADPASVERAVQESGATTSFCYVAHGCNMHPVFEAMKKAGITYVVLLSSWSVYPDRAAAAQGSDIIAKMHASAELSLETIGLKYTALRPCYFSSNIYHHIDGIKKGDVPMFMPDMVLDYLAPEDIGAVGGAKLVSEPEIVPIAGPVLMSQRQAFAVLSSVLGKDIKVTEIDEATFLKHSPLPEPITRSLIDSMKTPQADTYPTALYKEASSNIKKYTGREPTPFKDFVQSQKASLV